MDRIKYLILASRPKTLVAGLCPVALGASYSYYLTGKLDALYLSILILASVCIQIATNFFNDSLDSDKGRDSDKRLGPKRMVSSGDLDSNFLKRAALFLLLIALVCGIALSLKAGLWVFLIGLPALALAYLYTGSKFSLSMTGTADIFVVLYFGVIPVWATEYILSGSSSMDAALSGLQMGLLANTLLLINNLRDYAEDLKNNKKTLVVRFGRNFGLCLLAICVFTPFLLNVFIDPIYFRAKIWSSPLIFLSIYLFIKILKNEPSQKYNSFLGLAALNLLLFTYFFSLGIVSS